MLAWVLKERSFYRQSLGTCFISRNLVNERQLHNSVKAKPSYGGWAAAGLRGVLICSDLVLDNVPRIRSNVMRRYSFRNQCPLCSLRFRFRIRRKFYMRLIPGSRHYLCDHCGYTAISFFKKVSIRLFRLQVKKIRAIVDSYSAHAPMVIMESEFVSKDKKVINLKTWSTSYTSQCLRHAISKHRICLKNWRYSSN
jgi:hypothetical protein